MPATAWTPLTALGRRLTDNLAALAPRLPEIAERLRRLAPAEPYFVRPADGGLALGVGHATRELPLQVSPAAAVRAAQSLCPTGHCEAPLLVAGEDQGWLWDRLYKLPCRSAVPGWRPPLYLVLPDLERLWVLLHMQDWRTMLADARVRPFFGPGAVAELSESMATDLTCPLPHRWAAVDAAIWPTAAGFQPLLDAAVARLTAGMEHDVEAPRPPPRPPAPGRSLRVLGFTSLYTTFLQHSMRDWLAAFDRLGHKTRLVIEQADHQLLTPAETARACATFRPDLIISIDHGRHTMAGLPRGVPVAMWVQDHLPHIYAAEAGRAQTATDFCLGFGRLQLSRRYGYPADRFLSACVGVNDQRFAAEPLSPGDRDAFACDVSFVSHASTPADVLLAGRLQTIGSADGARLFRDVYDRMVAHYEGGGSALVEPGVRAMVAAATASTGVRPAADELPAVVQFFQSSIGNALFRHQTLRWVSDLGVDLRIYGRGWDGHPTLAKHARGTADNATQLSAIYRASRINLQTVVTGAVHQRLLDGLAAGGFFLIRRTPIDTVGRHYLVLWDWCQRHGITDEADFRRRSDDTVRRTCQTLNAILGYDMATSDLPLFDILQSCADADFMNTATALWPEYDQVSFDTAAELRARIATYLGNADARGSVAMAMRGPVVERASYRRITERLLELIGTRLGHRERLLEAA